MDLTDTDLWGSILPFWPAGVASFPRHKCLSPVWPEDHEGTNARHQAATSQPGMAW